MKKKYLKIDNIPAVIWGAGSSKVFLAVHGNKSNKEDIVIEMLAKTAVNRGYQIVSFDLPKHGDRVYEDTLCNAQNCTEELLKIYDYVKGKYEKISLWACSLGAFFSLLAYQCVKFNQCLFLSPVVDMQRLIENMMIWFEINEEKLKEQKMIETPIGETLYY